MLIVDDYISYNADNDIISSIIVVFLLVMFVFSYRLLVSCWFSFILIV